MKKQSVTVIRNDIDDDRHNFNKFYFYKTDSGDIKKRAPSNYEK